MCAGKIYNGNPISTKRKKLDGVGPVDNRPSTNKDGGWRPETKYWLWVFMKIGTN